MKTLTIEFDEFPDQSVTVQIQPVPMLVFLDVIDKMANMTLDVAPFEALAQQFVPFIESWTFPEPVSIQGLLSLDFGMVIAVVNAWIEGVRDVPRPLPLTSTAGTPSEALPA